MIDAREQKCWKILSDLFVFFPWRNCFIWLSLLVSLIFLILMLFNDSLSQECIQKIEDSLFNVNITVMGVDMAALAILFALFQDKQLSNEGKKAFKEQCGAFLFNAVAQLIALMIFVLCALLSIQALLYATFLVQIWAVVLIADVIVELFTITTAIINKH